MTALRIVRLPCAHLTTTLQRTAGLGSFTPVEVYKCDDCGAPVYIANDRVLKPDQIAQARQVGIL